MVIFSRILMFTTLLSGAPSSYTNDMVFHARYFTSSGDFSLVASLSNIPLQEKKQVAGSLIQSSSIYSLIAIVVSASLVAMIVFVVYKSYRKVKRRTSKKSSALNKLIKGPIQQPDPVYFTPGFFSHESVPAILVAESDEDLKLRLVNTLRLNYRVAVSRNGLHAFDKATSLVPDLVLVGSNLDEVSTSSLVIELKNNPVTSHIPVILIGDNPGTDLKTMTEDHLSISFDARDLLLRVKTLLVREKEKGNSFRYSMDSIPEMPHLSASDEALVIRIMDCLGDNHHNPAFGIEHLAASVGMNKLQIHRKIKALTGKIPLDLIRHFRIEKAKLFLRDEGMEIKIAAKKSGFSSLSLFTKAFKEYTGLSPAEYVHKNESVKR